MKRVLAGVAFVSACGLVLAYVNRPVADTTPRIEVVVARTAMGAAHVVDASDVELRMLPIGTVSPNVVISLPDAIGRTVVVPIASGQQLPEFYLTTRRTPE